MNQSAEEFDSTSGTWTAIPPDVAASDLDETPTPDQPEINAQEAKADAKADAKGKPRNDPRARVEAATAKEAEAKRERDEAKAETARLNARIAELEAKGRPVAPPVAAKAPTADAEPNPEDTAKYPDGQFDRKYLKDQARWEARQEIQQQQATARQQFEQQQRETSIREVDQKFGERFQAVLAEDPDFTSKVDPRLLKTPRAGVLEDPSTATFGNFLIEQVFHSERPKELLLHLSDPAVVQRLATLPPGQVIRELARYEASLGAASPPGPAHKALSQAKPPIKPVGSSPLVSNDEPGEDASDDEWLRHHQSAELKRRRAGRG